MILSMFNISFQCCLPVIRAIEVIKVSVISQNNLKRNVD